MESELANSRARGWALIGFGLLLGLGALVAWMVSDDSDFGDVETVATVSVPSTTTSPSTTLVDTTTTTAQTAMWQPNETSALGSIGARGVAPTRLRIGSIGVDAPVIGLGVDARTGQMEVPGNVTDVAWYQHGPVPGESGSAVLAAHVDLHRQGPGVFFNLDTLETDDEIIVSFEDGSEQVFVVVARSTYLKEELPLEEIFSREGAPVLTLVTCGGGFSASAQRYDSNVVVYAVPAESSSDAEPDV